VLGKDPFGGVFDEVARAKRIGGRSVVVRRFPSMKEYKPCHILFVAASAGSAKTAAAIEKLKNSPCCWWAKSLASPSKAVRSTSSSTTTRFASRSTPRRRAGATQDQFHVAESGEDRETSIAIRHHAVDFRLDLGGRGAYRVVNS